MSSSAPPTTADYPPAEADPAGSDPAPEALARLAALPVATVPGCNGAAVTLAGAGALFTVAHTGQSAPTVHQAQYRFGDGPCLTALPTDQVMVCPNYPTEQRWPDEPSRTRPALIDRETLTQPTGQGRPPDRAGELRFAQTCHNSLLPRALPSVPGLGCAARYLPSGQAGSVSGDWYDLFALPDGAFAVTIGDVMGHDAAAAAQMGQLRSAPTPTSGPGPHRCSTSSTSWCRAWTWRPSRPSCTDGSSSTRPGRC